MKRKEQVDQLKDMSLQELNDQADALKESLFRLKFRKTLGVGDTIKDIRREHRDPPACGPNIVVDYTRICARSLTYNPATAPWAALLPKIEKIARSPKAVVDEPWERTREACRAVGELPFSIGFERDKRQVELRYVN